MTTRISAAESQIMEALWAAGPQGADEIVAVVGPANSWGEATVKTLINRLLKKKALVSEREAGKVRYRPLVEPDDPEADLDRDEIEGVGDAVEELRRRRKARSQSSATATTRPCSRRSARSTTHRAARPWQPSVMRSRAPKAAAMSRSELTAARSAASTSSSPCSSAAAPCTRRASRAPIRARSARQLGRSSTRQCEHERTHS